MSDFNNIGVAVIFGATVNYFSLNKDEAEPTDQFL